jgi:hypothetical protein
LTALWVGLKKLALASVWKTTPAILDLLLLVIGVIALGWLGLDEAPG